MLLKHDIDHVKHQLSYRYNSVIFDTDISNSLKEQYTQSFYWIHKSALLFIEGDEPFGNIGLLVNNIDIFYD